MGIVQSDLLVRVAIINTLEEIRKNPWLIEDILSDLIEDPLLKDAYGAKEIANAKEWFASNKIEVYLKYRMDNMQMPCISISLGSSSEDDSQATLADQSVMVEEYDSSDIDKPIPYILKPTSGLSYNKETGILEFPLGVQLSIISPGMLILDPKTGNAYVIDGHAGSNGLKIKDSPKLKGSNYGVIPQYRVWKARRERASFRESYSIGCHVHGDTAPLIWLHSVVLYGLLRYRESLFEARGLQVSSLKSTDFVQRAPFSQEGGENIYSRYIILDGLVENSWIKSPRRVIESVNFLENKNETYSSGVKILSNLDTNLAETDPEDDDLWITKIDK